jgi:hypothetical protein
MGSSKKGMLNVLIAAVLWGSSGSRSNIMQQSQMSIAVSDHDYPLVRRPDPSDALVLARR